MSADAAHDPDGRLRCLLDQVMAEARATGDQSGCHTLSERVITALASVPRHLFVPMEQQEWAYADRPLPIGRGQTISQPFIVALMTDLLNLEPEAIVLEIGTGSGYQAAVLARLARRVYSVERIPELASAARQRLSDLGFANVEIRTGDSAEGWAEHAPYDGIMVTAAAAETPRALFQQLKPGGRLVAPVGPPRHTQDLRLMHKDEQGVIHSRSVLPVVFVPLVHEP